MAGVHLFANLLHAVNRRAIAVPNERLPRSGIIQP
jgi:hypothetical protein